MMKRLYGPVLTVMVCASMMVACGSNPTGPDVTYQPTTSSAIPGPTATPNPAVIPAPEPSTGEEAIAVLEVIAFSLNEGTMTVRNNGNQPHWAGLAVYRLNGSTFDQTFLDEDFKEVPAHKERSFKVNLPHESGVCIKFQLDGVAGLQEAIKVTNSLPKYSGSNLFDVAKFGGHYGQTGTCDIIPTPPTYGLRVTKTVKTKDCSRGESNASVTFDISVTNTSSVAASVNVVDPSAEACNRPSLALNAGASSAYTCSANYFLGQQTNTVTASMAGTSVSQSASVTFVVESCPPEPTCRDFPPPVVHVSLGTPVTSQTTTTLTVSSIPVTQDAGVTGSFTPSLPQTANRPPYGQPAGNIHVDYNWTYPYHPIPALNCNVSGIRPKDVPVPPQEQQETCDNYKSPTITGDIVSDVQPTQVVISQGTVAPSGGSFNPTLPQTVARPNPGQSAGSFSTTYTLPYGPAGLQCSVSRPFTKPVPPQVEERDCEDVNAHVSCSVSSGDGHCAVSWNTPPASGEIRINGPSSVPYSTIYPGQTYHMYDPPPGNYTAKLRVPLGDGFCEDTDNFTISAQGCADVPATSTAAQPFSLPNSSVQTETNWVNANASPGPYVFWAKHENLGSSCTTAGFSAKVVLLKAGTSYWYFLNVVPGQQLCSGGQGISHITKFRCPS